LHMARTHAHTLTLSHTHIHKHTHTFMHTLSLSVSHTHTHTHSHTHTRAWYDEESSNRRSLSLHNTQHSQETDNVPGGFRTRKPSQRASERPQTQASDRAATGID
jgi:hypothetical protein